MLPGRRERERAKKGGERERDIGQNRRRKSITMKEDMPPNSGIIKYKTHCCLLHTLTLLSTTVWRLSTASLCSITDCLVHTVI